MFNKMNTEKKTDYFKKVYKAASKNDAHELDGLLKEATGNDDFEKSLAGVCMELQVNRVLLLDETKLILYRKLLNLRFFHNYIIDRSSKNICDRIEFTKQLIQNLNESEKNDELFVLNLTFIAKQIFTFKKLLKSTYDRIPWEELEFCVLSFIKSFQDRNKFIIFTRAIFNKTKIVKYLQTLRIQLDELRKESVTELTKLPNLCRDDIIKKIVEKFPIYEGLYTDHERLRDIYSLNFMLKYVKLIETIDLDKKHDKLILIRAYQVIGEHLKNTLESPKLSENTLTFLYLSLSKNSRKILIDLRDTLFHNRSCSTKNTFFGSIESDIFTGIKQDVEKVGEKINFILLKSEIAITKELAYKFVDAKDIENMKEIASVIDNVQFDSLLMESTSDIQNVDIRSLRDLVSRLRHHITPKHSSILEICEEMEKFLEKNASTKHETFSKVLRFIYIAFENVYSYMLTPHGNMIHIESKKHDIELILRNLPSVKTDEMESIAAKIFIEVRSSSLSDKCKKILSEIGYILTFQLNDVSWAEKFKRKLKKLDHKDNIKSQDEENKISKSKLLTELKMIWSGISYSEFKSDGKLQAITEAILLDLIPMIKKTNSFIYFFDYNCPSLMWVDLRNHLAHNNVIMEVMEDFVMAPFLFVEKLLKVEEINMEDISSQSVTKVKQNYKACVHYLNKKELMFTALKTNNFDLFLENIHEGADYRSRDINMSTCLQLALTTPDNLRLIEFLWEKGLSSRQKNIRGHSALHIAALTGDAKNINFLLENFTSEINAVDLIKRTASHYASLNGHVSVMEILFKYEADMTRIDALGQSTLYYAITSGIIEIVEFFYRKKLFHKLDGCTRGFTALHIAAGIGSLQMLKFLLDKGVDVNARDDSLETPLMCASKFAEIELVQTLIDYGANVQFSDFEGFGTLHYVCEKNKVDSLKLLIENRADVNQKSKFSETAPIHIAATKGHVKMVNILLENNANINVSTKKGVTPLHCAVKNQHSEVVNVLISHKEIEVNCTTRYGMTPLLRAAFNGDTETIAILLEAGAEVNCRNNGDYNSLHLASQNGHEAAVNLLIANKVSSKQKTRKEGLVPLHSSIVSGNENIIKRLIEAGSDVNATTIDGLNCLHLAALEEKDIIDFLCREGVEVDAKARNGHTPLHLAVINDNLHIVKQLVKAGCNVNAQDFDGNTPIHLAVESTTAEFLMDIGADLTIYNKTNQTAFDKMVEHDWIELIKKNLSSGRIKNEIILKSLRIAVVHSNMKMVKVLLKQINNLDLSTPVDENGNTLLHSASLLGKVEIVELLLKYDVAVNLKNDLGEYPLYLAASKGHDEIVEMLLERGADINAHACDGQTALHIASAHDHIKIVEILLNKGADVGKLNENQFSAVEIAVIRGSIKSIAFFLSPNRTILKNKSIHKGFTLLHFASESGRKEVVKFLLQKGANTNAIDEDGNLPIHLAVLNGFPEIVDIFIEQGVSVNFIDKEKQSLLHFATRSGKLEIVKHLVERGCNVNSVNVNEETPIIASLKSGQREIAVFLLRNGAIINFTQDLKGISTNEDIREILSLIKNSFLFIETGETGELEELIKRDVPLNCVDSTRGSLLHFAARRGNVEAVKILLQNNATVDITDTKGRTPLHYAVKYSYVEIVFLLLSHGARFDVETNNGKKPISFATNRKIQNLLRNIDQCFNRIKRKDKSLINILKKIKSENTIKPIVRAKNHHGITLVASAIKNKFLGIDQLMELCLGNSLFKLNQGISLFNEGKYQEAKQLFEHIYAEMAELLGEDNPITLKIKSYIVDVLSNQFLFEKALTVQEEIYEKLVNQLGSDHEHTLRERVMIATLKCNLAKYEEALQIYQEVEKIQEFHHEDLLSTRKKMALTLMKEGQLELALNILKSVAQNEKMNDHISRLETLKTEEYIAAVLSKQGKFNEAIQLFQKLREEKKNMFGPYHPQIFATSSCIIKIYFERCEYYEASQEIEKLLNDQKKYLGTLHYDTLRTQVRKAHLLYKQHKNISAYKLYKETRQGLVDIRGSQCKEILDIDNMMKDIENYFKFYCNQSNLNSFIEELVFSLNDAAKRGDLDTIKKLTNSGMSVTEKDKNGFNSLHHAVNGNNIDTLKYLLEHGGDITETTGKNNTLLHLACNKCYKEIAQFILNFVHGQELSKLINIANKTGKKTVLHIAAERGSYEIVCLLLKKGAIFESLDKDSRRPIDLARDERTKKILSLIGDTFEAVNRKDFSIIQNLNTLDNDEFMCVTNAKNSRNLTILILSINFGEREIAGRILEMIKNKNAI